MQQSENPKITYDFVNEILLIQIAILD